jgi:hypothetical protein
MTSDKKGFKNTIRASIQASNQSEELVKTEEMVQLENPVKPEEQKKPVISVELVKPDLQIKQIEPINTDSKVKPVKLVNKAKPGKSVIPVLPEKTVKITLEVQASYVEMIKREAFWERDTEKRIINDMFGRHCEKLNFKPIPEEKKPTKRGPKPKAIGE